MKKTVDTINRFMRLKELQIITGLSSATLWRMRACGDFPPPYQIGKRSIGWAHEDVQKWVESKQRKQLASQRNHQKIGNSKMSANLQCSLEETTRKASKAEIACSSSTSDCSHAAKKQMTQTQMEEIL